MANIFELAEWLFILWNIQTYKNFLEWRGKKFFLTRRNNHRGTESTKKHCLHIRNLSRTRSVGIRKFVAASLGIWHLDLGIWIFFLWACPRQKMSGSGFSLQVLGARRSAPVGFTFQSLTRVPTGYPLES